MNECRQSDIAELVYRGLKVDCDHGNEVETIVLMGQSINEKAEWMADIAQVRRKGEVRLYIQSFLVTVCGE